MKSNNHTAFISLVDTEPSFFKNSIEKGTQASPAFIKDLAKSLTCVKSMTPLITDFKEELSLISKNFGFKNKFDTAINVVAEEMKMIIPNQEPKSSLEQKIQMRSKNNLNIKI